MYSFRNEYAFGKCTHYNVHKNKVQSFLPLHPHLLNKIISHMRFCWDQNRALLKRVSATWANNDGPDQPAHTHCLLEFLCCLIQRSLAVGRWTFWHMRPIAHNEDSDQTAHPRSLIRVFVVRMKKFYILVYPKCAQWRFWSECSNVQAGLILRWARMSEGTFSDLTA